MKILIFGDIYGQVGLEVVLKYIPMIKNKYQIDFIIANGENAYKGKGISRDIYKSLLNNGVQAVTLGNHFASFIEVFDFIDEAKCLIRPLNIHKSIKGVGSRVFEIKKVKIRVSNLLGYHNIHHLQPSNPFDAMEHLLDECEEKIHIVDLHAESTAEKMAIARFLDGKVSAVVGTHTHVQTADERILPNKTAFITDIGMNGPYDSIIGAEIERVISKMHFGINRNFKVAESEPMLNAVIIDVDEETGEANAIIRLQANPDRLVGL